MYEKVVLSEAASFFLIIFLGGAVFGSHWSYSNQQEWTEESANCRGSRQSPINIKKSHIVYDPDLKPLRFHNYDFQLKNLKIQNTGHTVQIDFPVESEVLIRTEHPRAVYQLAQVHFHWSYNNSHGSEHATFGHFYPFEMHMVHLKRGLTLQQAENEPDGVLVLGVLYKLGHEMPEMTKVANSLRHIYHPQQHNTTSISHLTLSGLLPPKVGNYLRYYGSLTTPGCYESVVWCIPTAVGTVSLHQLKEFRALKTVAESRFEANDRNLQKGFKRNISLFYDFDNLDEL